jgi:large subunit ribosomal protein L3
MIQALLGRKLGMTRVFDENGVVTASTLIEAGPCFITQLRTQENDGYVAVQLGFGDKSRATKPQKGHLKKAGLGDKQGLEALREVPADRTDDLELGARIDASMFAQGEIVDVIGTSKGKGFAGVMKRHNFHGGPKTHGQSDRWRHSGSVGSGTTPGRTFKNMRMAGHLGDARVTVKNLRILAVDPERNLVALRGAIPGPKGGLVMIRKKVMEAGF